MTELVPMTSANWRAAAALRVGPGQLPFVAGHEPIALVILSKAFLRLGDVDWWPYVVQDGGGPVGALALTDGRTRSGEMTLLHLFVDADRQGGGYGRAALRLVIELTRRLAGCERLRLTVHPDNRAALRLYLSEGFTQDAVADDGELSLALSVG